MEALLTFHVENKYAVTHFKRRTFAVQEFAMKFGTPVKEIVKSVFEWAAAYCTIQIRITGKDSQHLHMQFP